MGDYSRNIIRATYTIRQALESLNKLGSKTNLTLFVLDESEKLIATLTDGDIRRALLAGIGLDDGIQDIMHREFRALEASDIDVLKIKSFREQEIELIPVLDREGRITQILDLDTVVSILPVDGVIMAGGKGKRLGSLTAETPKPLLQVGDKTILEHGIDRMHKYGINNVYLSLNHFADKIKAHCGDGSSYGVNINYIVEEQALGTIGSVTLVDEFPNDYILVMNSDLLTNINLEDMFLALQVNNADMAVASIPYKVKVPYATFDLDENNVRSLREKPTYTYYSNGGIYLFKKDLLSFLPKGQLFNATDLMNSVVEAGGKLISFPILGYWLDIGRPEDYEKAQQDIKYLKL
jgi:dTDP-glucose pyrophosphorylase